MYPPGTYLEDSFLHMEGMHSGVYIIYIGVLKNIFQQIFNPRSV